MSWLSNSLKFAGDLLDSVDRRAETALDDEEAGEGVAKRRLERTGGADAAGAVPRYVPRRQRQQQQKQHRYTQQRPPVAAAGPPKQRRSGLGAQRLTPTPADTPASAGAAPVEVDAAGEPQPSVALNVSAGLAARRVAKDAAEAGAGAATSSPPQQHDTPPVSGSADGDGSGESGDSDVGGESGDGDGSGGDDATSAAVAVAEAQEGGPSMAVNDDVGEQKTDSGESAKEAAATTMQTADGQADRVQALQREVAHLNAELDEVDKHMVRAQAQLDASAATEADLRSQLADALAEARQARRDAERLARQTADTDVASVARIKRELAEADSHAEELQAQLDASEQQHAQALSAMRRELRAAEASARDAASDYSVARAAAQRREEELLNEAAELQQALSQAQQALEQRAGDVAKFASSSNSAEAEADLRREAAQAAEAALLAERRQSSMMRRDVRMLTEKAAKLQVSLETARRQHQAVVKERNETVAALETKLRAATAQSRGDRSSALEERLRTMAESVMAKQGQIDELRSETAALQRRLERERTLRREAEDAANAVYGGSGGSGGSMSVFDGDVELGSSTGASSSGMSTPSGLKRRGRGMRQRLLAASPAMSKLKPIARNPNVAKAIDVVDKLTLRTGFFLSREPLARLLFLVYLVFLHLWALFILSFHTHRLDMPDGSATASAQPIGPAGHPLVQNSHS